jgi:hypothetical protein
LAAAEGLERRPKDWDLEGIDRPELNIKCLREDDDLMMETALSQQVDTVCRKVVGAIVECKDRLCRYSPMVSVSLLNPRLADRGFLQIV